MEQNTESNNPVNPRRKKKTKMQIFKETQLPLLIIGIALILIIIFITGSITRAIQKNKAEKEASIAASIALAEEKARLDEESAKLLKQAEELATGFDYEGAITTLKSFSGNMSDYPALYDKLTTYESAFSNTVEWNDPNQIPNLSFQLLIADPERGFSNETYGYSINRNFITTGEFSKILQQLYDNNYMLVSVRDLVEETPEGKFASGKISLPVGKKPIVLSQVAANYFTYMTDGNEDGLPDAEGDGFPYCLALDEEGNFISKMIGADGNEVTGNLDLSPFWKPLLRSIPTSPIRVQERSWP